MKSLLIVREETDDSVIVETKLPKEVAKYFTDGYAIGWLEIDDNRRISADQRKKIYALFGDIANYTGHFREEIKDIMKTEFIELNGRDYFSLANLDMTQATQFIEMILDYCFILNIPFKTQTVDLMKFDEGWLFRCLKYRKCACGSIKCDNDTVQRHHATNLVGMGNDRKHHDHWNSTFIALCEIHHREVHNLGLTKFLNRYHIRPIKLTKDQCEKIGLKVEE